MKVGRIAYVNTAPYFHFWPAAPFELIPGAPRELAERARRNEVEAGPLPLVECFALEPRFEPLGNFGIAARETSGSVFVVSRRPFAKLDGATIGLTEESSTSVALCEILLREKHGVRARLKRGMTGEDDAWLLIGDRALRHGSSPTEEWPYLTDLASEWWAWKKLPFVFARWVVRTDASPFIKGKLLGRIESSLEQGRIYLPKVAAAAAKSVGLPLTAVTDYLNKMIYELDASAEESIRLFREMHTNSFKAEVPSPLAGEGRVRGSFRSTARIASSKGNDTPHPFAEANDLSRKGRG